MVTSVQPATKRRPRKRADGEDTIYQRADGLWVGEVMVGYLPDGKRDVRRVTWKAQAEVRRKLQALKESQDKGLLLTADKAGVTVAGFIERWLTATATSVRASTHRRYAQLLRLHVAPTLGKKRLVDLRASDVQTLLAYVAQQPARGKHGALLSASTVHHAYVALLVMLEDAV